jgi:membrane protease YdiL (CAAX protease family)
MTTKSVDVSPDKPKKESWTAPFGLVSIVVIFFGAQIIGGLVLYAYGSSRGWSVDYINNWLEQSVGAQFVYLMISEVLVLAGIYAVMRYLRWTRQMIGLTRPKLKQVFVGALAVVPYYVLYLLIVAVVTQIFPALNVDQKQEIGFDNVVGTGEMVLTFISLVVVPPIVEEIAMRGFFYSAMRNWLPKVASALVVSAVFGAAHLAEGGDAGPLWIGAIDTFTLSLVLVYLREKTGSLWAGITLHGLKNGIAFLLIFVVGVN